MILLKILYTASIKKYNIIIIYFQNGKMETKFSNWSNVFWF